MKKEELQKGTVRQRVTARSKARTSGRWEISRPLTPLTVEEQLERIFDFVVILSKETLQNLPLVQKLSWAKALETLRIWEYTGRVRRGYFIEGLSGIQFIRDKDFVGVIREFEHPRDEIIWLSAVDPAQPWGKTLPHMEERAFINVPGTIVALRGGIPAAVFERQGKVLRCFEDAATIQEALRIFTADYNAHRILPLQNRLVVKQYPHEMEDALVQSGFLKEIQDYVLYRN
jgi:ATP-dependent Lhr-like helicase